MIRASSWRPSVLEEVRAAEEGGIRRIMPIVTKCTAPGCETLTMGPLCVDHELALQALDAEVTGHSQNSVGASGGGSMPARRRNPGRVEKPAKGSGAPRRVVVPVVVEQGVDLVGPPGQLADLRDPLGELFG